MKRWQTSENKSKIRKNSPSYRGRKTGSRHVWKKNKATKTMPQRRKKHCDAPSMDGHSLVIRGDSIMLHKNARIEIRLELVDDPYLLFFISTLGSFKDLI